MKISRRDFVRASAGIAASSAFPRLASAQTWPARPVTWIVGFAPGGGNDAVARIMGQWLQDRLGQPVLIENRPGAGTNIATEAVIRAAPDGYTLLLAGFPNASNPALFGKLNFDFQRDTTPIAGIVSVPNIVTIHPSVPAKTLTEFIAYAKTNPGKLNMASAGTGSGSHLSGELFKMMAGVDLVHVPYRGNAPATNDLLSGQVQVQFSSPPSCIELIRAGQLRGLAVTSAKRSATMPDLPTVGEIVPGYEMSAWYGAVGPRGTPAEVVDRLKALSFVPAGESRQAFSAYIAAEIIKWKKVTKDAGVKIE